MFPHLLAISVCLTFATAQEKTIIETVKSIPELSSLAASLVRFPHFPSLLEKGNITLLAPDNGAFDETENMIEALWSYHVLDGTYSTFATNWTQYIPSLLDETNNNNLVVA
jgi:uncharacterized surface protein with fasciclin (FAS1) repeats